MNEVSFKEDFIVWFHIGLLSFGGPAGQIALMHRIIVDEKKWLDEPRFLHALNYCMLLPGPEAQQLATYTGWLLHGVRGGLVAGLLFIIPGALAIFLLSWIYVSLGDLTITAGIFFGLKAAVFAIVVQALIRIARRALKGVLKPALAVSGFVSLFVFDIPFPVVVLSAGIIGYIVAKRFASYDTNLSQQGSDTETVVWPGTRRAAVVVGVIANLALWFAVQAFFADHYTVSGFGVNTHLPYLASLNAPMLILAIIAFICAFRFKMSILPLIGVSAALGVLWTMTAG